MVICQHGHTGDKKKGSMPLEKEHSNSPKLDPELNKIYEMTKKLK